MMALSASEFDSGGYVRDGDGRLVIVTASSLGSTTPTTEVTNTVATGGSSQTIPNPSTSGNATINKITLTAATCTLTFPGNPGAGTGDSFTLILVQDGTGGRLVTWPTLNWPGKAGPPTLSAAAGAIDIFTFVNDGSGWYAFTSGLNMG